MNPFIKVSLIFAAYILPVDWVITGVLVVGELGDVGLTEATDGVLVTLGVSSKEFDATIAPSPETLQPSKNRKNNKRIMTNFF